MQEFESIIDKAYRNLEYIIHCKKTEEEKNDLIEKAEFGEEYFGKGYHPLDNGSVCNIVNYIARQKMHYSSKNKLREEFENKRS